MKVGDTVEVTAASAFRGEVGQITASGFATGTWRVQFPDGEHQGFCGWELRPSQQKLPIDQPPPKE